MEEGLVQVTAEQVATATGENPLLDPALDWIQSGVWSREPEDVRMQLFTRLKERLAITDGRMQAGEKVVVSEIIKAKL